ncbi:CU044_2847 family protein [Nonomuraea sp. SBT364]|uniref:CU044_2847 family protein n=1 Tax=Nonomuraea sp. SBT364 TaxID=1580530 RepID=UPI00066E6DE6|nr:CU044_2847 family protein [Nonomuraea sp. SBT364]
MSAQDPLTIETRDGVRYQLSDQESLSVSLPRKRNILVDEEPLSEVLSTVTRSIIGALRNARSGADRIKVEFGVTLTAEGGAIVTKGRSNSHFIITYEYDAKEHG